MGDVIIKTKQEIEDEELLESLIPSQAEIEKAERTIETIELLQELEVI